MAEFTLVLVYKAEDQKIKVGFQNETPHRFVVTGEITFNGVNPITLRGDIGPGSYGEFGQLAYDQISDYPHFEMKIERHTKGGYVEKTECKIKTKPKHFFKLSILPHWDNRPGRTYTIWKPSMEKNILENIPTSPIKTPSSSKPPRPPVSIRDLSELAVFNRELDLHAEKLFDNPKSVSPEVIFNKQIQTFQWFLDKAKSMDIDRVFIIHGIGSGRLKNEISNLLKYDSEVSYYTNEHHPKYGFGATEVVF
ncbi:MAG TPA: Smr/MutS family protein [Membranihabitans sp.]|nr:Smr/MutS family protein [Membranihabitans sp.]